MTKKSLSSEFRDPDKADRLDEAQQFAWLVPFQGMTFVVLAYGAVFSADLAVLFRIRYTVVA